MYSSLTTLTSGLALAALASPALATFKHSSCSEYSIPVTATSSNYVFAKPFADNYDVVDFVSNAASRTAASDFAPFSGVQARSANYTISATFCAPKASNASGTVLLLSHGLNFDRSYWNPSIEPEKYNFVDWALARGYSVFFYDRLGVGKSSKLSGFVNQASIQVSILEKLVTAVRGGKYTGSVGVPKKLVLVGHSYGSLLSAAVLTASPGLADGLIMTGFSYNGSNGAGFLEAIAPRIANRADPRYLHLDNGYLTPVDIFSNINAFLKAPDYDVNVAKYAHYNRQPFAIAEAISGGLVDPVAVNFTGAAMVIAGQFDLIFCTGQCDDVIEQPAKTIFSKAKAFKAISYPGAGHGLNFAANATGAFQIITSFLAANGL